jgi:transposase
VIDSHKQVDIIEILMQQPLELRLQVKEVSVDMWGGFPKVVAEVFPNAQIVFDRFHIMQPLNKELNQVRRREGMLIKGSKFILLKNRDDLGTEERVKLETILQHSSRLRLSYELKEKFRSIFESHQSIEAGKAQLLEWLSIAKLVYTDIVATIENHLDGICNYFLNRTTSGVMEGINNRIKLIKRQGYGFVNFNNFRVRLLACFSDKKKSSP